MTLLYPTDSIAIFGATGMAGSAISKSLFSYGYTHQLTPTREDLNLLDSLAVSGWFNVNRPDIVVLAAAKAGGIQANSDQPVDFLLDNLKIQTNVVESAWKFGVRRLLFLGSSCIYPKFAPQPIHEEALLDGLLEPTNQSYAIAKIAGIQLCESLYIQHGFDALCLMPTNLYGDGDNYNEHSSHVFASMIRRFVHAKLNNLESVTCWGSGSPMREFLHADDLADAVVFCLKFWDRSLESSPRTAEGKVLSYLNVGTGTDITIHDLAHLIAAEVGYQGQILWDTSKPDGTPKKLLDISRLKALGWTPSISLKNGVASAIKAYNQTISPSLSLNH